MKNERMHAVMGQSHGMLLGTTTYRKNSAGFMRQICGSAGKCKNRQYKI